MNLRLCISSVFLSLAPAQDHPTSPDRTADDLARLLARHVAWLGGEQALAALQTLSARGTLRAGGSADTMSGPVRADLRRRGDFRHEFDLGAVKSTVVVTATAAHRLNASGQVEPLPEHQAAEARRQLQRAFYAYLDPAARQQLQLLPAETRGGRQLAVLRWAPVGTPAHDFLIDPTDGSLACERSPEGDATWTVPSAWREVGGIKMPFKLVTENAAGEVQTELTWTELVAGAPLADALFARPTTTAQLAHFADGASSTGWLPLELYLDRYIYLRGTLQGVATDIVLDSGAGATVVDRAFATELQLAEAGAITAKGVGGTQPAAMLRDLTLAVGSLTLRGIGGVAIDLGGVAKMLGRPMPVILGKEVFHELVVDIDYPNRRIAFHRRDEFTYRGDGHSVPLFAGQDGHRSIEIDIEGQTGRFTVDTGSGATVDVFAHFAVAHRLLEGRSPTSQAQAGGVGGRMVSTMATLRTLTFAGYRLTEVPAGFPTPKVGVFAGKEVDGNLGAGVFRRFRMIFDYSRATVHVEPGTDWASAPFRRDRLGVNFESDGDALRVTFVAPGSPAADAQVAVGGRFVGLGGQPVASATWRAQFVRWADVAAGAEATLQRADGTELRLRARDYY